MPVVPEFVVFIMEDVHKTDLGLNDSVDLSKLSERERWRIEHERMHAKHRGHETMHAEMILILLVCLMVAQIILVQWKQRHFKSYQTSTLIFMWAIPPMLCCWFHWWRFIVIWFLFSVISAFVTKKATQRPLTPTSPRLVYKWFVGTYKVSYTVGIVGYCFIMGTFMGVNALLLMKPQTGMDIGLMLLFYGLYFGVVGRDFAEVCTDKMAAVIGYYTPNGIPTKYLEPGVCAVCGQRTFVQEGEDAIIEKTYKLSCHHVFHEFCIKGWCIVGKKQTCPYCKEKVDLKRMFNSPWAKTDLLYGNLLDWIRYLVAWQPLIILFVQGVNWALGLE